MPSVAPFPYTIFLDESGDHSLKVVDRQYPIFGLGAVLMESARHAEYTADLSAWKRSIFDRDVCLHMRDIARNVGPFYVLKERALREKFVSELQSKVDSYNFVLICAIVNKDRLIAKYGEVAQNPYNITLEFILERCYFELRGKKSAKAGFIAESRSTYLDNLLQAHYSNLLTNGTRYVSRNDLRKIFPLAITFEGKHVEATGLQIADLAIGPISRWATGMKAQPSALDLRHKLRRDAGGNARGYGVIDFPE